MPKLNIPGYQIKAHVGSGGMAVVFRAVQESLQRPVALKVLKHTESKEWTERFLNEGRILASMDHRNIITVHDIGIHQGHIYISMEYLNGGDLGLRIEAGMSPKEALEILAIVGDALGAAHRKGVIHRDVKPGNILFRQDGTPVIADFGIAKEFERETDITVDGTVIGTPDYLAPEQARVENVDGRTDLYGLGIIFYEMLTGKKPFLGDSAVEIVFKHINEPIPKLPEELEMYQPLLEKMTAKEPDDRFGSAIEMVAAVTELRVNNAVGGLTKGREKNRRKTDEKPKTTAKTKIRLALAAILVLACGAAYLQRASVLPFVEAYTGPLVDERGVMVHQKDNMVALALAGWQAIAPYFSWQAADGEQLRLERCRRQGRPDCHKRIVNPPGEEPLAGNASVATE